MTTRVRTTMFALLGVALCGCPTSRNRTVANLARTACDSDADCRSGQECERGHGERFCKPHGGLDDRPRRHAAADEDDAGPAVACRVDADCEWGEECEWEHAAARCKPHDDDAGARDEGEDDRDHDDDRRHGGDDDDNRGPGHGGDDNRGHGGGRDGD